MNVPKRAAALAAGFAAALSLVCLTPLRAAPRADGETLVVDDATVDWIERSNVAALREGVVERMELQIGMPVKKGGVIGSLHSEMADLTVKKSAIAANGKGAIAKASAQRELALSKVARDVRLNAKIPGSVSAEQIATDEAELKVAEALIVEAKEKTELDKAEMALAQRALKEHTIVAPFDGLIMERMKNPEESVRANEAVVKLGNLSKLRAYAYVPLEYAYRVKEGQIVELQVRLSGDRRNPLPIEQKRFRGKLTFVDPQIQAIAETAVRIHAEFDNKDLELRPGLNASMTIHLNSEGNAPARAVAPAVGVRTSPAGIDR